jgi:hypothetical protein
VSLVPKPLFLHAEPHVEVCIPMVSGRGRLTRKGVGGSIIVGSGLFGGNPGGVCVAKQEIGFVAIVGDDE